jgi:hypothetical protein
MNLNDLKKVSIFSAKTIVPIVGIGTTSPSTRLHVNGTVTATAFAGDGSGMTGVTWGNVSGKPFNYSGQAGQPPWLWGTNDGANYYVWNPSNFIVTNVTALAGTWDGTNYFRSNKGAASTVGANTSYGLEAYSTDGGAAGMSFHRGGAYAVNLGLDSDNVMRIGGWSAPANVWQLDMSGNQTILGKDTSASLETRSANVYSTANFTTPATARQITVGESSNNSAYRMAMGYYLEGGATWTGVLQATNNSSGTPLLLNPIGGNVGVGVSTPAYKLSVNGDVNVTGNFKINGVNINSGTVSSVGSGNGLTGGPITTTGTLAVDTGTTASKIPQLDTAGRYPATTGFVTTTKDNISTRTDSGFFQTSNATTATGWPVTNNSWYHLISSTHTNDGNHFAMQFAGNFFDSNEIYYRATNNNGATAWNKVWTSGNLTNLNQLTNGPGYITSATASLGYTPVNKAGDTMTGGLTMSAGATVANSLGISGADPYIHQTADNSHIVISGGTGWTTTGATAVFRGVSDASNSGGMDFSAGTSGTRSLSFTGFNSRYPQWIEYLDGGKFDEPESADQWAWVYHERRHSYKRH